METKVILTDYIKKIFETPSQEGSEWFGYYNYDTLNHDQTKLLCNRASFDGVAPEKGMKIELGYYIIPKAEWHHIADSDSWNWQQGAMLQWLPGSGNETKVIYNCTRDNHNVACIYDIQTHEKKDIDWAIYGITPDGKRSITLEMERSHWCRAYHYKSVSNIEWEGRVIEDDGIFEIDLEKNTRRRIIPIQDIISLEHKPEFDLSKHWLEHIMISPDGSRFCFLHRYSPENNIFAYKTRVCIANIDGSALQVIKGSDKYQWSHFGWAHNNQFCVYTYKKGNYSDVPSISDLIHGKNRTLRNVVKKIILLITRFMPKYLSQLITGKCSYYQYYSLDDGGFYNIYENWKSSLFQIDGHPSFSINDNYVITDTYPDNKGYQHLIVYNIKTGKGLVLAKLFAYYKGNPASCDLHPKLSSNNKYVVVDTAYDNKHHMMVLEINWELIESRIA